MGEIVLPPKVPCTFMLGYHNNESGTLRVLRDLWLHTGDLGFLDDDGYLYFRGREAHWLRRRGENISAYELESIISQYPGLKEIAVVGVPSEIGEEDVKLFVVPESSTAFDPAELVLWCAERRRRSRSRASSSSCRRCRARPPSGRSNAIFCAA